MKDSYWCVIMVIVFVMAVGLSAINNHRYKINVIVNNNTQWVAEKHPETKEEMSAVIKQTNDFVSKLINKNNDEIELIDIIRSSYDISVDLHCKRRLYEEQRNASGVFIRTGKWKEIEEEK